MKRPHIRNLAPRIVFLRLTGLTVKDIAVRCDCSERHVERTVGLYKAEGLLG